MVGAVRDDASGIFDAMYYEVGSAPDAMYYEVGGGEGASLLADPEGAFATVRR